MPDKFPTPENSPGDKKSGDITNNDGPAQRTEEKMNPLIAPMGEATSKSGNLNWQVSDAIREAELLEDASDPGAKEAFSRVSQLEEHLASLLPVNDVEGAVARRGAVRAAVKSGDAARAEALVNRFVAEEGINPKLKEELKALL